MTSVAFAGEEERTTLCFVEVLRRININFRKHEGKSLLRRPSLRPVCEDNIKIGSIR